MTTRKIDKYTEAVFRQSFNNIPFPTTNDYTKLNDAYKSNVLLYSIIHFKATKMGQIKPLIMEVKDEGAAKEFKAINGKKTSFKELLEAKKIRTKAYNEIPLDEIDERSNYYKLKKLLTKPNQYQSFSQFMESYSAFMDIAGWNAIYKPPIESGMNRGKVEDIYILPTNQLEIISGQNVVDGVSSYRMKSDYKITFEKEHVHRISSFSPNFDQRGGHLYGTSKVEAAWQELKTYDAAKNREFSSFEGGDLRAIITPKDMPFENVPEGQSEAATWYQKFRDGLNRAFKQGGVQKLGVYKQPLEVHQLQNSLMQQVTKDAKAEIKSNIASAWHMHPDYVFGASESSTLNNMKIYEKSSLRNGVFPEINMLFEFFDELAIEQYNGANVVADYDVFEEFTVDLKAEAEALSKIDFMSDNQKLEWLGLPKIEDDPRADQPSKYWDIAPNFNSNEL